MMLVDSHCHLDFPDFGDELDAVIARARAGGVGTMLTIGTGLSRIDRVRAVAEAHADVYFTIGIHPHEAGVEAPVTVETLLEHLAHPKAVGFGESGLDYFYERSPREAQRAQFRTHIAAARQANVPLVIHTRDADRDMAEILRDEMGKGAFTGLLHCFSSTPELGRAALELGLYLSISGIVTFNKSQALRDFVADEVPLDRLLVETDAPYLAPVPKRGQRNEPAFVAHTAAKLAEIKGVSLEDMARATTDNFFSLFMKAKPPCA